VWASLSRVAAAAVAADATFATACIVKGQSIGRRRVLENLESWPEH